MATSHVGACYSVLINDDVQGSVDRLTSMSNSNHESGVEWSHIANNSVSWHVCDRVQIVIYWYRPCSQNRPLKRLK